MSKKVVIVDYHLGNLFSVNQALINVGLDVSISSDKDIISQADAIVLPGVGAFTDAMQHLCKMEVDKVLRRLVIEEKKPFLGICLGLQLLFSKSEEFGETEGLGFIEGNVRKFKSMDDAGIKVRVPQIAWNTIEIPNSQSWKNTPLESINSGTDMYFVHSFYVEPLDKDVTLSETSYGGKKYTSSINKDNIFACQFHPEKSAQEGLKIYKKWSELNNLY